MAETAKPKATTAKPKAAPTPKKVLNLNESIITIRVELQKKKIIKSGKNPHARFGYFELKDYLPSLNELMHKYSVNDQITFTQDQAILKLIKGEETQEYSMPFRLFDTPLTNAGKKSMQDIQYLGALTTYYKRYLYNNAFGITDGEVIDSMDPADTPSIQPQREPVNRQPKPDPRQQPTPPAGGHSSYGDMNEAEATEKARMDALAKIMQGLNKPGNEEHRDAVLKDVTGKIGIEDWWSIQFTNVLTYNKLVQLVKDSLEQEKALAEIGI